MKKTYISLIILMVITLISFQNCIFTTSGRTLGLGFKADVEVEKPEFDTNVKPKWYRVKGQPGLWVIKGYNKTLYYYKGFYYTKWGKSWFRSKYPNSGYVKSAPPGQVRTVFVKPPKIEVVKKRPNWWKKRAVTAPAFSSSRYPVFYRLRKTSGWYISGFARPIFYRGGFYWTKKNGIWFRSRSLRGGYRKVAAPAYMNQAYNTRYHKDIHKGRPVFWKGRLHRLNHKKKVVVVKITPPQYNAGLLPIFYQLRRASGWYIGGFGRPIFYRGGWYWTQKSGKWFRSRSLRRGYRRANAPANIVNAYRTRTNRKIFKGKPGFWKGRLHNLNKKVVVRVGPPAFSSSRYPVFYTLKRAKGWYISGFARPIFYRAGWYWTKKGGKWFRSRNLRRGYRQLKAPNYILQAYNTRASLKLYKGRPGFWKGKLSSLNKKVVVRIPAPRFKSSSYPIFYKLNRVGGVWYISGFAKPIFYRGGWYWAKNRGKWFRARNLRSGYRRAAAPSIINRAFNYRSARKLYKGRPGFWKGRLHNLNKKVVVRIKGPTYSSRKLPIFYTLKRGSAWYIGGFARPILYSTGWYWTYYKSKWFRSKNLRRGYIQRNAPNYIKKAYRNRSYRNVYKGKPKFWRGKVHKLNQKKKRRGGIKIR